MLPTGEIVVKEQLDRERMDHYDMFITIFDEGSPVSLSSIVRVVIKLLDVNDNAPTFICERPVCEQSPESLPIFKFSIEEGDSPRPVGHLQARDPDLKENGQFRFSLWQIIPKNKRETVREFEARVSSYQNYYNEAGLNNKFNIDPESGVIRSEGRLNREDVDRYALIVMVEDRALHTKSNIAKVFVQIVDKNDNKPIITSQSMIQMAKSLNRDLHITTIAATDEDEGENARLHYRILSATPRNVFAINDRGDLRFTDNPSTPNTFYITVEVMDGGNPPLSDQKTFTLQLSETSFENIYSTDNSGIFRLSFNYKFIFTV